MIHCPIPVHTFNKIYSEAIVSDFFCFSVLHARYVEWHLQHVRISNYAIWCHLREDITIPFQVIASTSTTITSPPTVSTKMSVPTKKFVELLCSLPQQGLVPPLAYNMFLVVCCLSNYEMTICIMFNSGNNIYCCYPIVKTLFQY